MTKKLQFKSNIASLLGYQCPDWFRDAKFGIYVHWGVYSVPERGEWYPRNMYLEGHPDYQHHIRNYGHPSEFGYKDLIPLWTAEKWNPEDPNAPKDKYGGKSVIGAIFNRSGEDNEKRMLLSSEAAASLGVEANENRIITVTALRALKTVKSIKNKSDVKSAESKVVSLQNSGSENIALSKPYIQVGIFSIEQNARNTAEVMHQLNIQPTVKEQTSRNKTFWRVIVGPAVDMNERSTLLQKVKAVGFGDAYAVSK